MKVLLYSRVVASIHLPNSFTSARPIDTLTLRRCSALLGVAGDVTVQGGPGTSLLERRTHRAAFLVPWHSFRSLNALWRDARLAISASAFVPHVGDQGSKSKLLSFAHAEVPQMTTCSPWHPRQSRFDLLGPASLLELNSPSYALSWPTSNTKIRIRERDSEAAHSQADTESHCSNQKRLTEPHSTTQSERKTSEARYEGR